MSAEKLKVTFWGPRGTLPCSGPEYKKFGGHTNCVSVSWKDSLFVFDAGSGIFDLGQYLLKHNNPNLKIHLFFSHYHLDHIMGYPFFKPAWIKGFNIHVYGAFLKETGGIKEFFTKTLYHPIFPVSLDIMQASITYHDILPQEKFQVTDGVAIDTMLLNHPGNALGYRLKTPKGDICYLTDNEHSVRKPNTALGEFAKGARLSIYDSTYDDDSFEKKIGWGHSTWQEAIRLKDLSHSEYMAIYHHDPSSIDSHLELIEKKITDPKAFIAKQGQVLIF